LERMKGKGNGEKDRHRDWREGRKYGLVGGREYELDRMRGKGIGENKGNGS
jgi:hypothetical protein